MSESYEATAPADDALVMERKLAAAVVTQAFADLVDVTLTQEERDDAHSFLTVSLWSDDPELYDEDGMSFRELLPQVLANRKAFVGLVEKIRNGEARPPRVE